MYPSTPFCILTGAVIPAVHGYGPANRGHDSRVSPETPPPRIQRVSTFSTTTDSQHPNVVLHFTSGVFSWPAVPISSRMSYYEIDAILTDAEVPSPPLLAAVAVAVAAAATIPPLHLPVWN